MVQNKIEVVAQPGTVRLRNATGKAIELPKVGSIAKSLPPGEIVTVEKFYFHAISEWLAGHLGERKVEIVTDARAAELEEQAKAKADAAKVPAPEPAPLEAPKPKTEAKP